MVDIKITSEYITLGQFIKFIGIIANGSEAKTYLSSNEVYVNDELESRRGRKIYPSDIVKIKGKVYKVVS